MPIDTPEQLRSHIELAIRVELTTIPPYLYAMYSIADPQSPPARLIRSVVAEEMLHAALMANLLLAVGGSPRFHDPGVLPRYPGPLPHHVPELMVHLAPCSPEVVRDVFLTIEQPGRPEAPPEPDRFETLGQFYHALEQGVERLAVTHDLFAEPQLECQLGDPSAYAPVEYDADDSGGIVAITDLASACDAIEVVIHQGEGLQEDRWADPGHRELTHYAKFLAIASGDVPLGAVHPAVVDPKTADLPAAVRPVATLANALYGYAFVLMDRLFARDAAARQSTLGALYGAMKDLIGPVARYLMTLDAGGGRVAGPPFEFHRFSDPLRPEPELAALAAALLPDHPDLEPVALRLGAS